MSPVLSPHGSLGRDDRLRAVFAHSDDGETAQTIPIGGFRPHTKGLGLEKVGVKLDGRGHILTNDFMQTNVPRIYAVGDVTGGPYLAHKATKEGENPLPSNDA